SVTILEKIKGADMVLISDIAAQLESGLSKITYALLGEDFDLQTNGGEIESLVARSITKVGELKQKAEGFDGILGMLKIDPNGTEAAKSAATKIVELQGNSFDGMATFEKGTREFVPPQSVQGAVAPTLITGPTVLSYQSTGKLTDGFNRTTKSGMHIAARTTTDPIKNPDRPINEDVLAVLELEGRTIMVVADGMGGVDCGEVAAHLAVQTILDSIKAGCTLREAVAKAAIAVKMAGKKGMGTTLALIEIDHAEEKLKVVKIGDSGIKAVTDDTFSTLYIGPDQKMKYQFLANEKKDYKIRLLLKDVDLERLEKDCARFIEEIFTTGKYKDIAAAVKEQYRAQLADNVIYSVLGGEGRIEVAYYEFRLEASSTPTVLLAYSDGLPGGIKESQITAHARRQKTPSAIVDGLIKEAIQTSEDNITVGAIVLLYKIATDSMKFKRFTLDEDGNYLDMGGLDGTVEIQNPADQILGVEPKIFTDTVNLEISHGHFSLQPSLRWSFALRHYAAGALDQKTAEAIVKIAVGPKVNDGHLSHTGIIHLSTNLGATILAGKQLKALEKKLNDMNKDRKRHNSIYVTLSADGSDLLVFFDECPEEYKHLFPMPSKKK
ncbi:MAG: protein phosphatase 2C domain-containing protein, partial [Candidatus Margulisiibacteriota bacterium]